MSQAMQLTHIFAGILEHTLHCIRNNVRRLGLHPTPAVDLSQPWSQGTLILLSMLTYITHIFHVVSHKAHLRVLFKPTGQRLDLRTTSLSLLSMRMKQVI